MIYPKLLVGFLHAILLLKLKSYDISIQPFSLFLQFSVIDQIKCCKVSSQWATFNFGFISFFILLLLFLKTACTGIYPSSFTNVCFLTKTEFSNVVKCRWGSRGAVSSAVGSWQSLGGGWGEKNPWKTLAFLHLEDK